MNLDSSSGGSTERQFVDVLAEEFVDKLRAGNSPSIDEYAERYPDIADQIRDVFPALMIMNQATPDSNPTAPIARTKTHFEDSIIGDYKIVRKIGQGGMGVVYEAQQQSLDRRVALKVLPQGIAGDEKFIQRFQREARAAAKLHHTNIVPVYDVGQDGETFYYAMQYIEGQGLDLIQKQLVEIMHNDSAVVSGSSVSKLISEDSTVASSSGQKNYFKSIAKLGASAADALHYAHQRSIIHRDVKPSNLILDTEGVVWLADFGLAKTNDSQLTETGDFLGTIRYMSPERFKGEGDHRGDIYGLGITLYELATLTNAFDSIDRLFMVDQIANSEPTRPREINSQLPLDLETIIQKSMDKDPRRRYQQASEMADDLRRFVDDQPIHARRASTIERAMRWTRKHKAQTAAMVSMAIAIAALIVGTVLTLQQRNIAQANETLAKGESERADAEASRAKRSAEVTVDALTALVESVQTEMRNHPELLPLKQKILANAEGKLNQITQITDDSPQIVALKVRAFSTIGQLNYEIGKYDECRKYFEDALKLTSQLENESAFQKDVYPAKSNIFIGLGSMAFEKHDQEEARKNYQKAYDNNKAWLNAQPDNVDARIELARSADDIADTYVLLNERSWDKGQAYHEEAFDIRKGALESGPRIFKLDYDYAVSHMKIGDMYYGRAQTPDLPEELVNKHREQANDWFFKGMKLSEELVERYPDEDTRGLRQLAAFYERVADTCEGDEAHEYYMDSIGIKEKMAPKLLMDRNFQRDRAVSWGLASLHMHKNEDHEKAVEYMNKCLTIIQELVERIPDDTGLQIDEMMTWFQLGNILSSDSAEQDAAWRNALKIGETLIDAGKIKEDFVIYDQIKKTVEKTVEQIDDDS